LIGEISLPKRSEVLAQMNKSLFAVVRDYERFRAGFAREQNVSVTELRAIARIVEEEKLTPKNLAASLDLSTGAVTAVVDRLADSGYVTREPHPGDRRSLLLAPTAAGIALVDRVDASFAEMLRAGTAEISDERLVEFAALLHEHIEKGKQLAV
jgi:DNA-binding MarR family transcriptional regulator